MKIKKSLIIVLIVFFIIVLFSSNVFASDELKVEDNISVYPIIVVIISIFCIMIGKSDLKSNTIKFEKDKIYYPPNLESPIFLEYILKEKITKKGVISSLLYFAYKGYIKFEEYYEVLDDSNIEQLQVNTKKMKIIKIKEYKGKSKIDRMFFNTLFSLSNEIELDEVDGKDRINYSIEKIYEKITDNRNKAIMYKENIGKNVINIYYMIFIILTLIIINPFGVGNLPACIILIVGLIPFLLCLRLLNSIIIGEDFIKEEERILLFILVCFLIIILFWRIFCCN